MPGAGLEVPIWLLGSSLYSAQLVAALGLPFAFASHFAPAAMRQAIEIYRARFKPSAQLQKPYLILGLNVFAADTDAEARRLMTSLQMQFIALRRGTPGPLPAPVDTLEGHWTPREKDGVEEALSCAVVGSPETVRLGLDAFIDETKPDELICTAQIYDHAARLRSFEIASEVRAEMVKYHPAVSAARSSSSAPVFSRK